MAVELALRTDQARRLTVTLDGKSWTGPVLLDDLPTLEILQAAPYDRGRKLAVALGGDALVDRLAAYPEGLLLLDADEQAAAVPWEFASVDGRQLLACQYAMLRLVDRPAGPAPEPDTLRFILLGADPLVDDVGQAREEYRLQIDQELRAIRRTLNESGIDLTAGQIVQGATGTQVTVAKSGDRRLWRGIGGVGRGGG